MRNLLLALVFVGPACGPVWDFGDDFTLTVTSTAMPRIDTIAAVTSALKQLGGKVSDHGTNRFFITDDNACPAGWAAHVTATKPSTIQVCTGWRMLGDGTVVSPSAEERVVKYTITHELGHVLGVRGHLPCSPSTMMASEPRCYPSDLRYTDADVAAICDGGYALNLSACK